MTLFEYVYKLNMLLKEHPEYENLDVICSTDDEGNFHRKVYSSPSVGNFNGIGFISEKDFEDYEIEEKNAICIN